MSKLSVVFFVCAKTCLSLVWSAAFYPDHWFPRHGTACHSGRTWQSACGKMDPLLASHLVGTLTTTTNTTPRLDHHHLTHSTQQPPQSSSPSLILQPIATFRTCNSASRPFHFFLFLQIFRTPLVWGSLAFVSLKKIYVGLTTIIDAAVCLCVTALCEFSSKANNTLSLPTRPCLGYMRCDLPPTPLFGDICDVMVRKMGQDGGRWEGYELPAKIF